MQTKRLITSKRHFLAIGCSKFILEITRKDFSLFVTNNIYLLEFLACTVIKFKFIIIIALKIQDYFNN